MKIFNFTRYPFFRQFDQTDCGPTCLRIILSYYGKIVSANKIREFCHLSINGTNLYKISRAAESLGLKSYLTKVNFDFLMESAPLPCILPWKGYHFVVLYKIQKKTVLIADPEYGKITVTIEDFLKFWNTKDEINGTVLILEPSSNFRKSKHIRNNMFGGLRIILPYFKKHKSGIRRVFLSLIVINSLNLIFPFLTQFTVDKGIKFENYSLLLLIIIGQIFLLISTLIVEAIKNWLLIHISSNVVISLTSDFVKKLMGLPISFFDTKLTGDIMQRVDDSRRIERFLSSQTLNTFFSLVNILFYIGLLMYYNVIVASVFISGSILYLVWVHLFLKMRLELDYKRFSQVSTSASTLIQIINAMPEIKLNGSENRRHKEWHSTQINLFKLSLKSLSLSQYQNIGGLFINESKNFLIIYLSALAVIEGELTLGAMLAIQSIVGGLNGPLMSLLSFSQNAQDAKISLDRMSEIEELPKEYRDFKSELHLKENHGPCDIVIDKLYFSYYSNEDKTVLKNVNITIPKGQTLAIVGPSGSGKSTLLKLILKFYEPTSGNISVDLTNLSVLDSKAWRTNCGVVMQDGYIFSDTVLNNITESESDTEISFMKLEKAIDISNIDEFVAKLPTKYNTKIGEQGADGIHLSAGQKQRILIARAIYNNPNYLFFDEATSALDSENEKVIVNKLKKFFTNKTAIIIAHRLSTVQNADIIAVMKDGEIVELGSHEILLKTKGHYYNLIKSQLQLENI